MAKSLGVFMIIFSVINFLLSGFVIMAGFFWGGFDVLFTNSGLLFWFFLLSILLFILSKGLLKKSKINFLASLLIMFGINAFIIYRVIRDYSVFGGTQLTSNPILLIYFIVALFLLFFHFLNIKTFFFGKEASA